MDVLKSLGREPLLCREYFFLATQNSRYFKLSSKAKGHTKKKQKIRLYEWKLGRGLTCRGWHETQTPRIRVNATKSKFTAYSTHGLFNPRRILAVEFCAELIKAAAYLGHESVRKNVLKRCPRLAEAVNECCACAVPAERRTLQGRENDLLHERARNFVHPSLEHFFQALDWSLTNFSKRFSQKFRNSPALILTEMLFWNEKDSVRYGDFPDQIMANYTRHQNKLRHHWTGLPANH